MIFKQTEEDDFQWEENDELIRTGCVLVGPLTHEIGNDTDVRNIFKLICLYFLQVNVTQRLNGENVIVVSRLLLRVWTVAIEWEEHLSPPCHHHQHHHHHKLPNRQFQTHTTNISKASAALFDNFMSGLFVFAFGEFNYNCNHRHRRQSTLWFRVLLACLGWAWWHVVDQDCLDWFCLFYALFSLFVLHLLEWLDIHV